MHPTCEDFGGVSTFPSSFSFILLFFIVYFALFPFVLSDGQLGIAVRLATKGRFYLHSIHLDGARGDGVEGLN
jgi:hypothetical protein